MELYAEWRSTICEAANDFACLGVPQVDKFVEAGAKELSPIVSVADVTHGFLVTLVRSYALPVRRCIPDLASTVVTSRK